jgi:beta-galactosidase
VTRWREDLACTQATAVAHFDDGKPAITRQDRNWYAAGWLDAMGWQRLLGEAAQAAGLTTTDLPTDVRTSRQGDIEYVMNFSSSTVAYAPSTSAQCLLGARDVGPQGLAIWKLAASA